MSKNTPRKPQPRTDRFSQMSKQEEIIAEKKRLIEAKLKMMQNENSTNSNKSVLENKLDQISGKPALVNSFSNDGSFLEKFKKISNTTTKDSVSVNACADKKQNKSFNENTVRGNNSKWNNKNDQRGFHNNQQDSSRQNIVNMQPDSQNYGGGDNYQGRNYGNVHNRSNHNFQSMNTISSSQYQPYANNMNSWSNSHNQSLVRSQMQNINTQRPQGQPDISQRPPGLSQCPPIAPMGLPGIAASELTHPPPGLSQGLPVSSQGLLGIPSMPQGSSGVSHGITQPRPRMTQAPPGMPPILPQASSAIPSPILPAMPQVQPTIPALTSLVIPPPTALQTTSLNTAQVPPPPMPSQTNVQIPPPNTIISLQSIPEPQPLDTMSIPRPAPLNLLSIPPPLPLCLNQIPPPKDIDVTTIPPPKQMNIAAIQMPSDDLSHNPVLSTDKSMSPIQGSNDQSDRKRNRDCNPIERIANLVVEIGDGYEEIFKQKHQHEPEFWFLFDHESTEYSEYKNLVAQLKKEKNNCYSPEELYEPEFSLNDDEDDEQEVKVKIEKSSTPPITEKRSLVSSCYEDVNNHDSKRIKVEKTESEDNKRKRKRKSRWGSEKDIKPAIPPPGVVQVPNLGIALPSNVAPLTIPAPKIPLNKVTRTDKALLQYAKNTFGTTDLSEEDWVKAEDHFKINLLYQEMLQKRKELDRLAKSGRHKYEYDSDEEVEGGTWEHKLRSQEMEATQKWAAELTKKSEGKHHIGDFLPPEELKKFMEKYSAAKHGREPDISDYKEFKLNENNVGFKMLQKLGWKDGEGLGSTSSGIVDPINKAPNHENNQGLGIDRPENVHTEDNEYDAYRKRMMLAYRFRPNPLNNPRRPYY